MLHNIFLLKDHTAKVPFVCRSYSVDLINYKQFPVYLFNGIS
jgi:hypothetical protein